MEACLQFTYWHTQDDQSSFLGCSGVQYHGGHPLGSDDSLKGRGGRAQKGEQDWLHHALCSCCGMGVREHHLFCACEGSHHGRVLPCQT